MRVLIVEDEPVISLDMQTTLSRAGHVVVGTAGSVRRALAFLDESSCDIVVLDMNLGGESAAPVVDLLQKRGIGFICISGYSAQRLPVNVKGAPLLSKPVEPRSLIAAIKTALPMDRPRTEARGY